VVSVDALIKQLLLITIKSHIQLVWPVSVFLSKALFLSHILIILSSPPLIKSPFGNTASENIVPSCPLNSFFFFSKISFLAMLVFKNKQLSIIQFNKFKFKSKSYINC
jgi:hypothetical protein